MDPRISWDTQFSEIAALTARRSPCRRLQVGCVLVKDKRVIATGYNGFLSGCPHTSVVRDGHEQATVHAEQNAIFDCARRGQPTEHTSIYITHYPCINCTKAIIAAGIRSVQQLEDQNNDDIAATLFQTAGVRLQCVPKDPAEETVE